MVEKGFGEIGSKFHGLHIVGYTSALAEMLPIGLLIFSQADPLRKVKAEAFVAQAHREGRWWRYKSVVSPQSFVATSVKVGDGSVIMPGVVVLDGARIGNHVFLGANATISADAEVRDFASVMSGAIVGPKGYVGTGALCGMGSITLANLKVGAWSQVTPGTVLRKDLPAGKRTF